MSILIIQSTTLDDFADHFELYISPAYETSGKDMLAYKIGLSPDDDGYSNVLKFMKLYRLFVHVRR